MTSFRIIIVGAGLGGLAAAAGLLRLGHSVEIYEQASKLGEIGAGIMLTPNAVRALDYTGVLSEVRAAGIEPQKSKSRHYLTGESLGERPVAGRYEEEFGAPMINIHRADLHRILAARVQALDPDAIRLGRTFVRLNQVDESVEAEFADGSTAQGDVLIGADGIRSQVRAIGLGHDTPPRFTNFVAWRGLVPLSALPERLRDTSMTSWVSPDRHIIEYAVGDLKNYVALALQPGWRSESWSTPSSIEEVLGAFPDWHEDISVIIKATPAGGSFKFALFDRDPLPEWTSGRVSLLGDAAHPMLPLMAQGSAMALEDAAILARAFDLGSDAKAALIRYSAARLARTAWVQLRSREARDYYHSTEKGPWERATKERSNVLYTYDVQTTPL